MGFIQGLEINYVSQNSDCVALLIGNSRMSHKAASSGITLHLLFFLSALPFSPLLFHCHFLFLFVACMVYMCEHVCVFVEQRRNLGSPPCPPVIPSLY